MRLLIVKLSSIGDVVQGLAVLEPLRPLCSHLGWVVEAPGLPLVDGHPLIDRVHVFPKEELRRKVRGGGIIAALGRLRDELHAERYDAVLDLQGLFKSAVVVALSGARRRVGFAATRELAWLALSERVSPGREERHAVLKYLELARHLGGRIGQVRFPVHVLPEEERRVEELLADAAHAGGGGEIVTVCPRTRWESKQWPPERFAHVAAALVRELGARVVLAGGEADKPVAEAIRDAAGQDVIEDVINLAGDLTLREFAHLCRLSRLVISCDSGPMHLAAAVEAPVVAIFGPTAPWRTGPFGAAHRVVRKGLTCSPCFRKHCASRACMEAVTEADVLAAARGLWEAFPRAYPA